MNKIFLTGSTGFVGKYYIKANLENYIFINYKREEVININEDIVIHLAGKAHDLKNVLDDSEYYTINTDLTR